MHLTSPLFGRSKAGSTQIIRKFKDKWKALVRRKILIGNVPESIQEHIVDAKMLVNVNTEATLPTVKVPEPWCSRILPKNETHPQWKNKKYYVFSDNTKLMDGVKQAQVLSNSIIKDGLSSNIEALLGIGEKQNQDDIVKRIILQSQVYDGFQEVLPKVYDPAVPHIVPKRTYGIPKYRQTDLLMRNLVRIMELQTESFDGLMKRNNFNSVKSILATKIDDDIIQYNLKANILITSKTPLNPFANSNDIATIYDCPLPDIYPFKYTLNLHQTNIPDDEFFQLDKSYDDHIHTIYVDKSHPELIWDSSSYVGNALVCAYAFALAQARRRYGDNIKKLPQPVVVQCVMSNGNMFTFISFQLNTMDNFMETKERNLACIQPEVPLFKKCFIKDGRLTFDGYNSDVYENLLAMHMNGMDLSGLPNLKELTNSFILQKNRLM